MQTFSNQEGNQSAPNNPEGARPPTTPALELLALTKSVLDSNLPLGDKKALMNELRKFRPSSDDRWVVRWALGALACIAIGGLIAMVRLMQPQTVPTATPHLEALVSIISTAVGALAGFLSSPANARAGTRDGE